MNAKIICKQDVTNSILDVIARELPVIIAAALDVPGGNLARLKPEQISMQFSTASTRDVGADIKIMVFAKKNDPRVQTENERAKTILDNVLGLFGSSGETCSVDVRLYFLEIGRAEYQIQHQDSADKPA